MTFQNSILSVFPPPALLTMPGAGIDISGGSIKCVMLARPEGKIALSSYGQNPIPLGTIVGGDIENKKAVTEILRMFRLRHRIHYAFACLPERKAYLYQTVVPRGTEDVRAAVEFDLEGHVPLPPSETVFGVEQVRETSEGTVVSVTAYARRVIAEYSSVFADAPITI